MYIVNLDFCKDKYRFNARVSAVIYDVSKTKVLLFKVNDGRDFYMLPGGRIKFNEDSENAISREIKEELGLDLTYDLCSIQENFVSLDNVNIMQYCFCYRAIYKGKILEKELKCLDNSNQTFYWVDIKDIDDYKILPLANKELIKDKNIDIKHIIEK